MKKIIILSGNRSGSNFLLEGIALAMEKQHGKKPQTADYNLAGYLPKTKITHDDYTVLKCNWCKFFNFMEDLHEFDAIILSRKDHMARCISMAASLEYDSIPHHVYNDTYDQWKKWLASNEQIVISKAAFYANFWAEQWFNQSTVPYLSKFKSIRYLNYEDFENSLDPILTELGLPTDIDTSLNPHFPIKRNWDMWSTITNKKDLLEWANELFPQFGRTIDEKYKE